MRSKSHYRGLLGKPVTRRQLELYAMKSPRPLGLLNEPPYGQEVEWGLEVLRELFLHYDVDCTAPNGWRQLAIALAVTHVPAFKVAGKTGPKGDRRGEDWMLEVEEIKRRNRLSDRKAVQAWRDQQPKDRRLVEVSSLETRLREVRASSRKEMLVRKSREALIREAARLMEGPPSKAASRKKRRS
jgi:hypothetical protein